MSFAKNDCQHMTFDNSLFNLTGREAKDIAAEFAFTDDGQKLIRCPVGHAPKSCNYIRQTGQYRISFPKNKYPERSRDNPIIL